jgi:hypothetical protein
MRRDHRGLPDAHPGRVSLIVDRRRDPKPINTSLSAPRVRDVGISPSADLARHSIISVSDGSVLEVRIVFGKSFAQVANQAECNQMAA